MQFDVKLQNIHSLQLYSSFDLFYIMHVKWAYYFIIYFKPNCPKSSFNRFHPNLHQGYQEINIDISSASEIFQI